MCMHLLLICHTYVLQIICFLSLTSLSFTHSYPLWNVPLDGNSISERTTFDGNHQEILKHRLERHVETAVETINIPGISRNFATIDGICNKLYNVCLYVSVRSKYLFCMLKSISVSEQVHVIDHKYIYVFCVFVCVCVCVCVMCERRTIYKRGWIPPPFCFIF